MQARPFYLHSIAYLSADSYMTKTPSTPALQGSTAELVEQTVKQATQMLEDNIPQHKILVNLVSAAETVAGNDSVVSILLLDEAGLLRNGCSPKLPYDYLTAIDGLKPNANVGTCAAAAATGNPVMTLNFQADNKWAELRHLPIALGFVGAWSMPIKDSEGKVLGTFGTYYREQHSPSAEEIEAVRILAGATAKVLTYSV
jgi:GAF domain-containing protein